MKKDLGKQGHEPKVCKSRIENQIQLITLPNLKPLKIGNTQLNEKFKIKVWIPDQSKLKEIVSL